MDEGKWEEEGEKGGKGIGGRRNEGVEGRRGRGMSEWEGARPGLQQVQVEFPRHRRKVNNRQEDNTNMAKMSVVMVE